MESASLVDARKQFVESAKAVEEALRQLTVASVHSQLFEGEVRFLKTQISQCLKPRHDATSSATELSRHSWMPEALINLLMDELNLLTRWKSTGCDTEALDCKVADFKSDINESVGNLRRNTFGLYASTGHNVDHSLLGGSKRLKKSLNQRQKCRSWA